MKKLFISLLCGCMVVSLFAQAPQAFNFQGVVRDNSGKLLSGQSLGVTFSIYKGSADGQKVYEEYVQTTTDQAGVISLPVGKGSAVSGRFSTIDWSSGVFYLKTSVLLPNTTQAVEIGTLQLLSVPYALYAETAGGSSGSNDGIWKKTPSYVYTEAPVFINNSSDQSLVNIMAFTDSPKDGFLTVNGNDEAKVMLMSVQSTTGRHGGIALLDENAANKVLVAGSKETGAVNLIGNDKTELYMTSSEVTGYNTTGYSAYSLYTGNTGAGTLNLYGTNRYTNVQIGAADGDDNTGGVWIRNNNGSDLLRITSLENYPANGGIAIYGGSQNKGMFYVAENGKSRLVVDEIYNTNGVSLTSSTVDHTVQTRSGESSACYITETSDNQILVRGTALLQDGECVISLPSDAIRKIQENTVSIQLTPLSASSKGLAVVRKETASFAVAELMSGTGSYEFDWTLTAVRKENTSLRNEVMKDVLTAPVQQQSTEKKNDLQPVKGIVSSITDQNDF